MRSLRVFGDWMTEQKAATIVITCGILIFIAIIMVLVAVILFS
jgi:hypothetical protein